METCRVKPECGRKRLDHQSYSSMNATLTNGQRRWNSIHAVQWVDDSGYWISKSLRHKDDLREADGAIEW